MDEIYDYVEELRQPKSLSMFSSKSDMLICLLKDREKSVETIEILLGKLQEINSAGWQDICTAPKDGTQILAIENFDYEWEDESGISHNRPGDWSVVKWHPQHEEWMSYGLMLSSFEPTHWMPLPEPPK